MLSHFSRVSLSVMLWTVALQAPLSMGFSRDSLEWLAMPSSRGPFQPEMSPASAGGFFTTSATWKALRSDHITPLILCLDLGVQPQERYWQIGDHLEESTQDAKEEYFKKKMSCEVELET